MKSHRFLLLAGLLPLLAGPALAADWGTIKGQVIWGGDKVPKREPVKVDKDKEECLKNGPVLEDKIVVDKDSKGVRWVLVWLADAKQPKNVRAPIPIHPTLMNIKDKDVVLDQPHCMYIPHVMGLRTGQVLVCKNTSKIVHNVKIDGGTSNPNLNQILPPGGKFEVPGWNPTVVGAVQISCSIHGWMKSWVRVFNHPYFAVTNEKGEFEIKNAPAGEYRLVIWHPEGWVLPGLREGMPIKIKASPEVTDVGKVKFNPS